MNRKPASSVVWLIAFALASTSCRPTETIHTPVTPAMASELPRVQGLPQVDTFNTPVEDDFVDIEPELPAGSGQAVWAKEFPGKLIAGLDGGLYVPYRALTIEKTQLALIDRGLYTGPVSGVLDAPTMQAIYEFQEAARNVQRCGVPTPRTRQILEQGSHTDPAD